MTSVRTAVYLRARPADTRRRRFLGAQGSELPGKWNGMPSLLNLHVLVARTSRSSGKMTPMPKRETTWPTTSVSLLTGA